jgi:hypothetical protein
MSTAAIHRAVDAVDWSRLAGAHGRPAAVGGMFRALLDGDAAARARAVDALREELVAARSWSAAGAVATPILLALARVAAHPARAAALGLLADILAGDHVARSISGVDLDEDEERERYAAREASRILEAISSSGDLLLTGVDDRDAGVRSGSAFVLAFLSPLAARARPAIERAARREADPWTQASLLLSLAFVARYRGEALSEPALAAFTTSAVARCCAWLAPLYAEDVPRELGGAELDAEHHRLVLELLRAGPPPRDRFPWHRGHSERLVSWQLADRGDAACLFGARALAEAAMEDPARAACLAIEALRLCFEEEGRGPSTLDDGRRSVVEVLSTRDLPAVSFARFGLPATRVDRLRWIGRAPATVLEKQVGGGPLWRRLVALRGLPTPTTVAERRAAVRAEIDAWLDGTDALEALALVAAGAHGLRDMVDAADVRARIGALGRAADRWAAERWRALVFDDATALRNSGVGMALAEAVTRTLAPEATLASEHDALFSLDAEAATLRAVLERMTPERRATVVDAALRQATRSTWNADRLLTRLLSVSDLVLPEPIATAALALADAVASGSMSARDAPADAAALVRRVRARYGGSASR